jgi:hypothetical protein
MYKNFEEYCYLDLDLKKYVLSCLAFFEGSLSSTTDALYVSFLKPNFPLFLEFLNFVVRA